MMQPLDKSNISRRQLLKQTGSLAVGAGVLGSLAPRLFAAEDNTIRLALIGCGGRGTGAVGDALSVPGAGPIKLYAMADLEQNRMESACKALREKFQDKVDVAEDRKFVGWRAYRQAVDSPWQYEWNVFIDNIRHDRAHNELKRAVYSDLTSLMGRAACHTGQTVTWDQMMKSRFQFCDYPDELNADSPVPVKADRSGQFPVPIPGQWTEI